MGCLQGGACTLSMLIIALLMTLAVAFLFVANMLSLDIQGVVLFENTALNVSRKYTPADMSPFDWTYYIWAAAGGWQLAWLTYGLTLGCVKHKEGSLLTSPPVLPSQLYLVVSVSAGCSAAWLLLWDRGWVHFAFIPRALVPVLLVVCLLISHRRLNFYAGHMTTLGLDRHRYAVRALVQNGLAFYAAWACVVTLLNLSAVLKEYVITSSAPPGDANLVSVLVPSLVVSGGVGLQAFTWFVLDTFAFDRHTRFTLSPYAAWLWYLVGAVVKNWSSPENFSTQYVVLLSVTGFVLCLSGAKVSVFAYRQRRKPLYFADREVYQSYVMTDE